MVSFSQVPTARKDTITGAVKKNFGSSYFVTALISICQEVRGEFVLSTFTLGACTYDVGVGMIFFGYLFLFCFISNGSTNLFYYVLLIKQ